MKESFLKYLFCTLSGLLLVIMLLISKDAGITCDEVLHYDHSVSVYNYFASHGQDLSSLNTPVTNLKYYGQSYDNIVTILIRWFHIGNVYGFRHFMSSIAGWLTIIVTALFAVWLAGYRAGIIVIVLSAFSPVFIGHSQNNLKDIPFALGYISGIYLTIRFVISGRKISLRDLIFLTASIAFTMSIRSGGLLLICYLFFFFFLYLLFGYINNIKSEPAEIRTKLLWIAGIIIISWLLSILLWPFALQAPIRNVLESFKVMAHFPDTFRQIFEGKVEWSDFMPWYYLIKSMAITIPIVVIAGFFLFFVFVKKIVSGGQVLQYVFILFTIFFPLLFVLYEKSNLYSSWRQFLFLYPVIILIAATGFNYLFDYLMRVRYARVGLILFIALLSVHPVMFMVRNHRYAYIYYNQFVGGLKGAYGNYETDYYYVSQTEASLWLLDYLKEKKHTEPVKIKATYSVSWLFREHPETETSYFRFEERSMSDWDYAIVVNRYISPFLLKNNTWPPGNAIHVIYADDVPLCAVLKRESKDDLLGFNALTEGRDDDAVKSFEKALLVDKDDEMIYYNYAAALYAGGLYQKADSSLKRSLEINPDFELALMYLGNIARSQNKINEAILYYRQVIKANRKYFEAYVSLAELLSDQDKAQTRELLRSCLTINPRYKPAIIALADTYRDTDPEIAGKYDRLANSIGD
ncbi:MAG: tetratricopeptide repeat protein [Bacteroidales bacterium]|nr:tetratricopeptide repeat protein [Bacteroidales bacterium]